VKKTTWNTYVQMGIYNIKVDLQ